MAFVAAVTYRTKEREAAVVIEALRAMLLPTRQEPGCITYEVNRSPEDSTLLFLYEKYETESDYDLHKDTPHFKRHISDTALPRLETREVTVWETLD